MEKRREHTKPLPLPPPRSRWGGAHSCIPDSEAHLREKDREGLMCWSRELCCTRTLYENAGTWPEGLDVLRGRNAETSRLHSSLSLNAATFNHLCCLVMNIWGLQTLGPVSTYSKNHLLYPDRRLYVAIFKFLHLQAAFFKNTNTVINSLDSHIPLQPHCLIFLSWRYEEVVLWIFGTLDRNLNLVVCILCICRDTDNPPAAWGGEFVLGLCRGFVWIT